MTYPGLGGQQQPPYNAPAGQATPVGIQPGVSGQIVARKVIIIGTAGELLVYSPTQGANNLIAAVSGANTKDQFGDPFYEGVGAYAGIFAAVLQAGQLLLQFANGQITGGYASAVSASAAGVVEMISGGTNISDIQSVVQCLSANANTGTTEVVLQAALVSVTNALNVVAGALTATAGATITGGLATDTLTVGGSSNTGSGNNGGVTSGPSGTVNAFPAAGPNHTHAEVHQHPL